MATPPQSSMHSLMLDVEDRRSPSTPTSFKCYRRRKSPRRLNLWKKLEMINAIEVARGNDPDYGRSIQHVAMAFGVSKSCAYQILRQRHSLRKKAAQVRQTSQWKTFQKEKTAPQKIPARRKKLTRSQILQIVRLATPSEETGEQVSFSEIGKLFGISMSHAYEVYLMRHQLLAEKEEKEEKEDGEEKDKRDDSETISLASPNALSPSSLSYKSDDSSIDDLVIDTKTPPTPLPPIPPQPPKNPPLLGFKPSRPVIVSTSRDLLPDYYITTDQWNFRLKLPTVCKPYVPPPQPTLQQ